MSLRSGRAQLSNSGNGQVQVPKCAWRFIVIVSCFILWALIHCFQHVKKDLARCVLSCLTFDVSFWAAVSIRVCNAFQQLHMFRPKEYLTEDVDWRCFVLKGCILCMQSFEWGCSQGDWNFGGVQPWRHVHLMNNSLAEFWTSIILFMSAQQNLLLRISLKEMKSSQSPEEMRLSVWCSLCYAGRYGFYWHVRNHAAGPLWHHPRDAHIANKLLNIPQETSSPHTQWYFSFHDIFKQ